MLDVKTIRQLFPTLNQKVNDCELIYLDNGATTHKPKIVLERLEKFYKEENSNIHRGVHYLSQLASEKYELARGCLKNYINASLDEEIIFTKGTTESINLVANSYKEILAKGDEIIVSELEHHSNIVPWQICCNVTGAKLKVIPVKNNGELDIAKFEALLTEKTKLVAITHISNVLGTINPIKKIIDLAHQKNAVVLVDGAQASGHTKVDVIDLDVDFYCFSAHKMYGPTGIGLLYGKKNILSQLSVYQTGGGMVDVVSFKETTYADLPYKFEAGTPNIAGAIAWESAIDFISNIGLKNIQEHEDYLLSYATKKLNEITGLKIHGEAEHQAGIISFTVNNIHPYDIGMILNNFGIAVRTGHHCAQPLITKLNVPGTVRISFGIYNTKEEVEQCVEAIKKALILLKK
ncbi:MAG: cysteine desulfurase [Bacteroidota bacterium]|nr:cysteine desulfurase [Bacteroidota bacterium]